MSKTGWLLAVAIVAHTIPMYQIGKTASATQTALVTGSPDDVGKLLETTGETTLMAIDGMTDWGNSFSEGERIERYKDNVNAVVVEKSLTVLHWMNSKVKEMATVPTRVNTTQVSTHNKSTFARSESVYIPRVTASE